MSKVFKTNFTSDFVFNTLYAVTLGTGIAEYSMNIFFNEKYVKYFKEAFKNNSPIPLSKSLRKRYDDVICDLKYTDFQKSFSTPFVAEGLEPVNVGCLNTRFGCYIGIPTIYDLNSIDDTTESVKSELQEYIQLMNEDSKSRKKFIESLIFSESAKKFSIARELILTDNFQILIKSVSFPVTLMPMYAIGYTIISLLPANPFKIRALTFFLLCNVGVFVWLLVHTAIDNFYQSEADKKVCDIGLEYIHGGIEYYEKLIQRNLILRNIIPDGKNLYSEQGNKLAVISVFSELPLTYRKKCLENRLKTYTNENNETSVL